MPRWTPTCGSNPDDMRRQQDGATRYPASARPLLRRTPQRPSSPSQAAFARTYRIDVAQWRDLEQGRRYATAASRLPPAGQATAFVHTVLPLKQPRQVAGAAQHTLDAHRVLCRAGRDTPPDSVHAPPSAVPAQDRRGRCSWRSPLGPAVARGDSSSRRGVLTPSAAGRTDRTAGQTPRRRPGPARCRCLLAPAAAVPRFPAS